MRTGRSLVRGATSDSHQTSARIILRNRLPGTQPQWDRRTMAPNPSVLLVATATTWLGTARIPRGLARAGFAVSLLAPRNSLAERSRFVTKIGYLPDRTTPRQWVHAFAATVGATAPRLVIPCDDMAFRLLQMLVLTPPPRLQPALHLRLAALIRESLGDPAHYRTSTDKTLLPAAATALGISVPPYAVCTGAEEIDAFAMAQSWPVVVKRRHGFAGQGVAICGDREDVARALATFAAADAQDLVDPAAGQAQYLVQATTRSSSPRRARITVALGCRQAMRCGPGKAGMEPL